MKVELLYFDGCPNHVAAEQLVQAVAAELDLPVAVDRVLVEDHPTADQLRFTGSPTVRVDGVDVEPGWVPPAEGLLGCRVYQTDAGLSGVPDRRWLRQALLTASGRADE